MKPRIVQRDPKIPVVGALKCHSKCHLTKAEFSDSVGRAISIRQHLAKTVGGTLCSLNILMFFKHLGLLTLILAFVATTPEAGDNVAIAAEPRNICMQVDPSMKHTAAMIDLENRLRSSAHFEEFMLIAGEMTRRLKEADADQLIQALSQADLPRAEAELGL